MTRDQGVLTPDEGFTVLPKYGFSVRNVRNGAGRRGLILLAATSMVASLVTVVVPTVSRAAAPRPAVLPTSVPGSQPGDLIRYGEATDTQPGFSYNNRISGMPGPCGSDYKPLPGAAQPYCADYQPSDFFAIDSLSSNNRTLMVTVNNPAYSYIRFYENSFGYAFGGRTQYFSAASHGWLYQTNLSNSVASGDNIGGGEVVKCLYNVPCEVDLDLQDQYGGYVGDAFANLEVQAYSNGVPGISYPQLAKQGDVFVPLQLTRNVQGYVRDANGNGIAGVTVTATGPDGTKMTNVSRNDGTNIGLYQFTAIPAQAGWTFTASDTAGDLFNPPSWSPDVVNTIPTQDFVIRPGLSSAITVTTPDGAAYKQGSGLPGDQLVAHVKLTNSLGAPLLTGLTVDTPLTSSAAAPVSLGTPTALSTTTLSPGSATSYDVPMTVTGAGRTTLHMAAHGTGTAREDTSSDQLLVLGSPLLVSYRFSTGGTDLTAASPANTFVLPDNDDGEVPTDVTVTEKLLNRSGGPVDTVTAQPLDLLTVDPNAKHLPFPVTVTSGPTYASGFNHTLADGASTTVTWTLHVVKNIDLRVRDIVLSHSDDGAPNDTSIGEDVLHIRPAHELLLKVTNDDGTTMVKTGHPFTLTGTVTNLDQSRALDLDPLIPDFDGNAGGQAALSDGTPTLDGFVPPVAGKLDPGEQKTFTVTIQTIKEAGTRGVVTWTPTGKVVNADGSETALAAKDMRIAEGTTPMQLHLDDRDPAPIATTSGERAWVFSAAALETMRDWCANGFNAVTDWRGNLTAVGSGLVATGGIIVKNAQALKVGLDFTHAATGLVFYWDSLSEAERQAFSQEVAVDLGATNEAWREFANPIQSAVFSYFQKSQTALAKGDLLELAQIRGERFGTALPEGLSLFAPEVVLNKVARGLSWGTIVAGGIADTSVARAISLGEKLKESGLVLKAAKGIEGVKVGGDLLSNSYKVLIKQFGMSARDVDALRFWAQKNKLLIAVRQRSELTLHWLHEFKAVLKPELVKIKNVDAIDTKYLGYLNVDEGSVVFREPLDKKLVQAKIRSAPPELRSAIAKRYGQRVKEWKKYEKEYKRWDGTFQELGFDKKAQGIVEPTRGKARKFELGKSVDVHGGDEYYRIKIGDEHGVPRRVTGDIDVVAITNLDGTIPSAAVRSQMYEDLQAAIGMQHGETLSWILKGELLSETKAGLLADHLPGRELLAVFGPDGGCRAAYFDPGLTIFNQQTGVAAATFIGAYTTPLERAARYAGVNLARFF